MNDDSPCAKFYCFLQDAPRPRRAEPDAMGQLPLRALRYCEASRAASAFGWWLFPPMDFSLLWDGERILWTWDGREDWLALNAAQFPHFARVFDRAAPPEMRGFAPPFLTALPETGLVQIWTGLFARCAPRWSLLTRAPANMPPSGPYLTYEGVVEADSWFGPVFANLQLTQPDQPVRFLRSTPLLQIQPVPRIAYADAAMNTLCLVDDFEAFTSADWADYFRTIVVPNREVRAIAGAYAVEARRRGKGACPV